MRESSFEEALVSVAQEIERFGLGVIVTKNPFRSKKEGHTHCFILIQPEVVGEEVGEEEFEKRVLRVLREYQNVQQRFPVMLFGLGPVISIGSVESWLNAAKERKMHPILMGDLFYGTTDIFLSVPIFGGERHKTLVATFQSAYGPSFIQDCHDKWMAELKKREDSLARINAEIRREATERKKPFNSYEVAEIKGFLLNALEAMKEKSISAIVGIDRSGRPLAVMLVQLLKELEYSPLPLLCFLDPHQLRKRVSWSSIEKPEIPKEYNLALEQELPSLFGLIQKGKHVLVVDDQVYSYMNTIRVVEELFRQVRKDLQVFFLFVSHFNGMNGLTWWKNKSLLRVGSNEEIEAFTLQSVPRELSQEEVKRIATFEAKLHDLVIEVAREVKGSA